MIRQRTLRDTVKTTGVGLHCGTRVELTLRPAPADTGIVFRRTDLPVPVWVEHDNHRDLFRAALDVGAPQINEAMKQAAVLALADYAQAALGKPVRVGKPQHVKGLPEAHSTPGFSTLAGLILYAAADPIDIRSIGPSHTPTFKYKGFALVDRLYRAVREYF